MYKRVIEAGRQLPAFIVCALALAAQAQTPPDAGRLLDSIRPTPALPAPGKSPLPTEAERPALSAPDSTRILVKGFRFSGLQSMAEDELMPLVQEGIGRELTLAEINALVRKVTLHYRSRGLVLARAYLPAQDVKDGIIEIAVLEGRIGKVNVDNGSDIAIAIINNHLVTLVPNSPVEDRTLERSLLLLKDLPGVEVSSTLKPGASVGTSDLDIRVQPTQRFSGSVDADNFGNRYTGDTRLGLTLNYANPLGRGDLLTLRGTASSGMDYARLGWQTPLGGDGLKAGAAWSDMRYRLEKDFANLHAHGTASIGTLWLSYPLLRSQISNLSLQLSHDGKALRDRVDSTSTVTDKDIGVSTLSLSGDRLDGLFGGGLTSASLGYGFGKLRLDPVNAALDQAATGHQTQGRYDKWSISLSRVQQLGESWSLLASLSGQVAGKNLDSSEKFTLGGAQGVRAYPQGEASGDDAWLANLELRYSLPQWADLQAIAFHDVGEARINHRPLATDIPNTRRIAGEGFGLQWIKSGDFALKAHVAWRATARPVSDVDRAPRVWVQFAKYF